MSYINILANMAALAFVLSAQLAHAESIVGRVVGVHDGDTITLLTPERQQVKIRLAQIDAPESNQDFGQVSKQSLSGMVFGKDVSVEVETTDKYGRTVGKVLVGGMDANLEQVKNGMAWVYVKYAHERFITQQKNRPGPRALACGLNRIRFHLGNSGIPARLPQDRHPAHCQHPGSHQALAGRSVIVGRCWIARRPNSTLPSVA